MYCWIPHRNLQINIGYITMPKVDLRYSHKLHDFHASLYPLIPEKFFANNSYLDEMKNKLIISK